MHHVLVRQNIGATYINRLVVKLRLLEDMN